MSKIFLSFIFFQIFLLLQLFILFFLQLSFELIWVHSICLQSVIRERNLIFFRTFRPVFSEIFNIRIAYRQANLGCNLESYNIPGLFHIPKISILCLFQAVGEYSIRD